MPLTKGNPHAAATVLLALVLVVIAAAVGINLSSGLPFNLSLGWPPSRDYVLSASFTDANGVSPGANVLIAGAQVGQVTGIRIERDQALVTMRINRRYGPLHQGSVAAIRYSTLLAQKYVELTPASGTPPLPSGAVIPSAQTVTPVDFDQFLSSLDARTRQQLQVLVQQLGGGVTGEQAAINTLVDHLAGLSELSPPTLDTFRARDPELAAIVSNLDIVSARLAQSHQQLGQLVQNTAVVTETLARSDAYLDGLLVHMASVSQDTSQTLQGNQANLRTTIGQLDPFLAQLTPQLSTSAGYLHQAGPTLRDEATYLIPEVVSAISQQDAGGHILRQFVIVNTCYDTLSSTRANPKSGCVAQLAGPPPLPAGGRLPGAAGGSRPHKKRATRCPSSALPVPRPSVSPLPVPLPSVSPLPVPLPSVTSPLPLPHPTPTGCPKPHRATKPKPALTPTPSPTGLLGPLLGILGGMSG
jgi:phospholipid/cholesterol/gamma-HCH transport system substrate-binding protein